MYCVREPFASVLSHSWFWPLLSEHLSGHTLHNDESVGGDIQPRQAGGSAICVSTFCDIPTMTK